MNKLHVKKGDEVVVINGKDRGSRGKVMEVSPSEGKVIVEGRNMIKKHVKARKMGDPSGIIEAPAPMYASKVQVVCPSCKKACRVSHKLQQDENGKSRSVRVCNRCGEVL